MESDFEWIKVSVRFCDSTGTILLENWLVKYLDLFFEYWKLRKGVLYMLALLYLLFTNEEKKRWFCLVIFNI